MAGLVRLVHPFPSILDGVVVGAVALLAGGGADVAARLAGSMTALQFAIGALNDLVDAPADAGRRPPKPIPARIVSVGEARTVAVTCAVLGVGIAATVGFGVAVLALLVLAIGASYDLAAKGTAWSWLPFAIGIPVLPVYGWYGATGSLPPFFAVLVPMTVLAGAALAIANARVDLDTDLAAGTRSVASRLGDERAWWVHAGLWVVVLALAVGWLVVAGAPAPTLGAVVVAGVLLAVAALRARGAIGRRRRWAWELEAIVASAALVVWLVAVLV
jgi:1,4-dihydroxy-2-naphthoate octaprenyltransferase